LIFPAVILKLLSNHDLSHTAAWAGQEANGREAAVWEKSWLESNFKIGAQRINVLVSSMWLTEVDFVFKHNDF